MVNFCLTLYFPTWFEIKLYHQIIHESKNFFSFVKRISSLSNEGVRHLALNIIQRNGYFAHPESILITMLGDDDKVVRDKGISLVLALRKNNTSFVSPSNLKLESRHKL